MGNTDVYPASTHAPVRRRRPQSLNLSARAAALWRAVRATNLRLALAIGAGAFVLRAAWVLVVHRHGWAVNDALFYDIFAQQLAKGHGFTLLSGAPSAAWPPAYPFVLSLAFRAFGNHALVGELTNAFIGALTVPLLYLVALRLFGRREAIFCAVALALLPVSVYFTDVLVTETFATFLLVLLFALLVVLPRNHLAAIPVGLVIGVFALTRGDGLLLIAVPMVVWWTQLTARDRAIRAAVLVASVALVVTPWTIRNHERLHANVLVSTNGGQTLYSGHNPRATGGPVYAPPALVAKYKAEPNPKAEIDQDHALRHYAIRWATHHPLEELMLIPKRFMSWLGGDGNVIYTWVIQQGSPKPALNAHKSWRLSLLADVSWFCLLGAFVFTLALARRALFRVPANRRVPPVLRGVLAWIAIEAVVYCVVLYGQWRYHVPLEPLMLLVVSPVVCAVWAGRREIRKAFAGPLAPAVQGGNESC